MNERNFRLPEFEAEGADRRAPHPTRSDLLESTKLSRLPQRTPFSFDNVPNTTTATSVVCAGCGGKLDRDDNFQQSIHGCRKCIGIYARIDQAIEESAKRKKREMLERFATEVNR